MPVNSYCMFKDIGEESLTTLIILGTVIVIVLVSFVVLLSYLFTNKKNKLLKEKELMQSQFQQELLRTQLEIQEHTLKTISEEIHDNIGQVLSLAKLNLNTLPNSSEQKIQDTKNLVSKAINDLRNLSHSLHGDIIAELGLQQSIANELTIIESTKAFETEFKITGTVFKLDPKKEMILFRILQEALNNCIKYSAAKKITVLLQYLPQLFILQVQDDGKGFDATQNIGIGLKSMLNRTQLIDGTFNLQSTEGEGTLITVELPC
jgi:two-component system, NarL family, sensor kinase